MKSPFNRSLSFHGMGSMIAALGSAVTFISCVRAGEMPDANAEGRSIAPTACVFVADLDKKDCREGLVKYWKLAVDAKGEIIGEAGDVAALDDLLVELNSTKG